MSFSGNVGGRIEPNHHMLCVYGLSKGCNPGMTEYINLEFSNDEGNDQLTKKVNICTLLLQQVLLHLLLPRVLLLLSLLSLKQIPRNKYYQG